MTQNTQTTEERVYRIMLDNDTYARASYIIAAEIDRLTAERDEARAEVERFRPAAEAWEAREAQRIAFETFDRDPTPGNHDALTDANRTMLGTGLRARAAKEAKP